MRLVTHAFIMVAAWCLTGGTTTHGQTAAKPPMAPPVLHSEDNAATILDKALKAHGGKPAFSRWNCGYLKYTTKGGIVPAVFGEVTVEDTFQLPAHFRRMVHAVVLGKDMKMIFVDNQGKGWTKKGDAPAEPTEKNFTEWLEHPLAGFANLSPLMDADVRLTRLKPERIAGKDTIGLRVESARLGAVDCYFDTRTGLLTGSRKLGALPGEQKQSVMETILDDYRVIQGYPVPFSCKATQDGRAMLDFVFLEVRFADKIDPAPFAKP